MIRYKKDVVAELKEKGYSSYRIRKEGLIGQATLQMLRNGKPVSWDILNTLCRLLGCQVGELLEYVPDPPEEDVVAQDPKH